MLCRSCWDGILRIKSMVFLLWYLFLGRRWCAWMNKFHWQKQNASHSRACNPAIPEEGILDHDYVLHLYLHILCCEFHFCTPPLSRMVRETWADLHEITRVVAIGNVFLPVEGTSLAADLPTSTFRICFQYFPIPWSIYKFNEFD